MGIPTLIVITIVGTVTAGTILYARHRIRRGRLLICVLDTLADDSFVFTHCPAPDCAWRSIDLPNSYRVEQWAAHMRSNHGIHA